MGKVVMLTGITTIRQGRAAQRERDKERDKLYECISDKDAAIQALEVQLARVAEESMRHTKRSNDMVAELDALVLSVSCSSPC